jgi:hypothetical protein
VRDLVIGSLVVVGYVVQYLTTERRVRALVRAIEQLGEHDDDGASS